MSSFYFDEDEENNKESFAVAGAVGNTLQSFVPGNAPDPNEQYSYHEQMFSNQYNAIPPPVIPDPSQPGANVLIASRNFQVSLVGDEGPDEWLAVSRAADNLTSIFDDTRDARYELENRYFAHGNYRPINFGIPNYTGDAGYPITDPNPGNCKPGFLKDQFGRCIAISWFNLPHPPAGSPWTSGTITNGMNAMNGVCPPNMFRASNNRCYMYPDPPNLLPPPPPPVSGTTTTSGTTTSGGANYAASYFVAQPRSPNGRVYNMPRTIQAYNATVNEAINGYLAPDVNSLDIRTGQCRISQVYVDAQNVEPGDRVTINTSVILFKNNYRVAITIPNLNFTTVTPPIPVAFPGVTETIETDFVIPEDTQPGVYGGEVTLIRDNLKMDTQTLGFNVG